jgi:hypothetical protein
VLSSLQTIQFEVSSPTELQEALAVYLPESETKFATVRVYGPQILTRQFHFPPNTSQKDIIAGLQLEAADTLSVSAADVAVIYKTVSMDEQGVYGIFSAISRSVLMEYLNCFKEHDLIPVSLIASATAVSADFLKEHPSPGGNYCLVNFLNKQTVNIAVFSDGKPAFFRELNDLNDHDTESQITDTIRYSCSRSFSKKVGRIFFSGDLTHKEDLMKNLKRLENFSETLYDEPVEFIDLTCLNLFQNYVLSLRQRTKLIFALTVVSIVSLSLVTILGWQWAKGYNILHDPKTKVDMSAYQRALDLQNELRRLNNAK